MHDQTSFYGHPLSSLLRDSLLCPREKKALTFLYIQPASYRHPVNTGTFYDPLDVSINGVCDFTLRVFYLQHNYYKTKLNVLALRQRADVL